MSRAEGTSNNIKGNELPLRRVIGEHLGDPAAGSVIFIGGVHGNEPSGVLALHKLFEQLNTIPHRIKGNILAVSGNHPALIRGERFINEDLNRIWLPDITTRSSNVKEPDSISEDRRQLYEILSVFQSFLGKVKGSVTLIDLHTTSSLTKPFIFTNALELNIKFSKNFPLPLVSGIGNFLRGTLLTYMNKLGHAALAYEAGQHIDPKVVDHHLAFAWMGLVAAGILKEEDIIAYSDYQKLIMEISGVDANRIYNIIDRYEIKPGDGFQMLPGFHNFQNITVGQILAQSNSGDIRSSHNGKIFMPLYQKSGSDGFFVIQDLEQLN